MTTERDDDGIASVDMIETKSAPPTGYFGLEWLLAPNTTSGINVTAATAPKCATVAICLALLANGTSIPCKLYERVGGAKQPAPEHPGHVLAHRDATEWMSATAFRATITRDAILTGNGFAYVNRDLAGRPVELIRLAPHAVSVETDDFTGEPRYRIALANGAVRFENYSDILHITSGVRADDGVTGVSLIHLAKDDIATALLMARTVSATFANNSRPGGVLQFPKALGDDALGRIRTSWNDGFSGEKAGRTAVLHNGATYQTIQQPLAENEAEKLLIQANVAICRHFNVPPHLAFEMGRATWSNAAEMNRAFLDYSLAPWLREWCAAYRRVLLTPEERGAFLFEFETDEFVKSDTLARWQSYQIARSAGVLTANEVRAIENMPRHPSPEADALGNPYTNTAPAPTSENPVDQ